MIRLTSLSIRFAALAAAWLLADSVSSARPVGGGLLDAGLTGEYFANESLSGVPTFTRKDIRLDFDWGNQLKPGGALPGTRLDALGVDGYSIRWSGRLMPRFTETYAFVFIGDSVRVWLKPASQTTFSSEPQLNFWPASDASEYVAQSLNAALVAGQAYDIRVEYRERTGPARMSMRWSSPSTPEEVIAPTAIVGEQPPSRGLLLADAIPSATNWAAFPTSSTALLRDPEGWPAEDFTCVVRPIDADLNGGTYLLRFQGTAKVTGRLANATFRSADGSASFGSSLDPLEGYDGATNTTTARMVVSSPATNSLWPTFERTDRDGPGSTFGTGSGVTRIQLMRPVTRGGSEPHGLDETFDRSATAAFSRFVTFRWNDVNSEGDVEWSDRQNFAGTGASGNENHEYKILWCNHTGRDLWLQVPHRASNDYITRLARLVRHGSDAAGEPYPGPTANPAFPPLNPNLRVFIEYSNEAPWNSAGQYPQGNWMREEPERWRQAWIVNPTSPNGLRFSILNYDGFFPSGSSVTGLDAGKRYFALRTQEISEIFRSVFGDDAMPAPGRADPRVRPLLNYQYDNNNNTARDALTFLDNYFNKADPLSPYAGTPRPVSHFLWGGGAATYYASEDRLGVVPDLAFNAAGIGAFQLPSINPGEARVSPADTSWSFTGQAGIYHQAARSEATPGALGATTTTVDGAALRGFRFTVGPADIAVYELGRLRLAGNSGIRTVSIYDAATGASVGGVDVDLNSVSSGAFAFARTGRVNFVASRKFFSHPFILQAGRSYYLVAAESNGMAHHTDAQISAPAGITIDGSVTGSAPNSVFTPSFVGTTPGRAFGPVNLRIATVPVRTSSQALTLGFVNDSKEDRDEQMRSNNQEDYSTQAAFLAGTASAEVPVTFTTSGTYGLVYHLAYKRDQQPWLDTSGNGIPDDDHFTNPPRIFLIDGTTQIEITPSAQDDTRAGSWNHDGYWAKPSTGFDFYGSAPFRITDTSRTYRIRFVTSQASTDRVVLLDNISIANTATMLSGTIPAGGGLAEGAPDVSNWEARLMRMYVYAQSFGLRAVAYEGGWYPGGDANKMPLQFEASFHDPLIRSGEYNAINAIARAGLSVNTDYSRDFAFPDHDLGNHSAYMRPQAWDLANAALAPEATNGLPLNSTLSDSSKWWDYKNSAGSLQPGGWIAWNVIAPVTGHYVFQVRTTGNGGQFVLTVDEAQTLLTGASGSTVISQSPVFLTKGLHSLRLRSLAGTFTLQSVSAGQPGQSFGPAGLEGQAANAHVNLRWPAVAGATGYHIYYKTRLESDFTRYTGAPLAQSGVFVSVAGLANDTSYNFVITAVLNGVESGYSNQVTVVPSATAPILAWDFTDALNKSTSGGFASTLNDPAILPSAIMIGPGATYTGNTQGNLDAVPLTNIHSSSFDPIDYIAWTLAPADTLPVHLQKLVLHLWQADTASEATFNAELRVSLDDFATFERLPLSPSPANLPRTNLGFGTGLRMEADLRSLLALQEMTVGKTASFRLYLWGMADQYKMSGIGKRTSDGVGNSLWFEGAIGIAPPRLELSAGALPFGFAGGTQTASIECNRDWTATADREWLILSPLAGTGDGTLSITATPHAGSIERSATVTVAGGGLTRTIIVTQAAAPQGTPEILLSWDFTDSTVKGANAPTADYAHTSVLGGAVMSGPGGYTTNTNSNLDGFPIRNAESTSLNPDDFIAWSLTVAPGSTLSLRSVHFGIWQSDTASASTFRAELRASADGFLTHAVVPLSPTLSSGLVRTNLNYNTGMPVSADLSGISTLQNLAPGQRVDFRLHVWGMSTSFKTAGIGKLGASGVGNDLWIEGTASVHNPARTFAQSMAAFGLTGDAALPEADPDGDALANLLEYAFALNPTEPNSGPGAQPSLDLVDGTLRFDFRHSQEVTSVVLGVERSSDLQTWIRGWSSDGATGAPDGSISIQPLDPDQDGVARRRAEVPLSSTVFMRIVASMP